MSTEPAKTKHSHTLSLLEGENALYIEGLLESYLKDPASVSKHWQNFFDALNTITPKESEISHRHIREQYRHQHLYRHPKTALTPNKVPQVTGEAAALYSSTSVSDAYQQTQILHMIDAFRTLGHLAADTNPLAEKPSRELLPELTLKYYGLDQVDTHKHFNLGDLNLHDSPTLKNIYHTLRATYTRSIGIEYMHIMDTEERQWLQRRMEYIQGKQHFPKAKRLHILQRLIAAEEFEKYLHKRYVGQKRFSLEGGESFINLLDELFNRAGIHEIGEIVLGMAHRGRLNVLVNLLDKPPHQLFREFEGTLENHNRTGDVKYHQGYAADLETPAKPLHVALAFNPSHLEIIGPVVQGAVRARQTRREDGEGKTAIGIIVHGDAAFAGQGVVMETFNMSQTRGYGIKGTIHIVINNQIGFTTSTRTDSRSTYYPTDVAKMVNAPIFHVNGDDPEAVVLAAQLALDYRMRFQKDVVIDLVCYRRHGHNEADEPAVTQPVMYQTINSLATTREKYTQRLIEDGIASQQKAENLKRDYRKRLEAGKSVTPSALKVCTIPLKYQINWKVYQNREWQEQAETQYPIKRLQELIKQSISVPDNFSLHRRIQQVFKDRLAMAHGEKPLDWGCAENLAYASLIDQGYAIRLAGQDTRRGTFFHRHAVVHHQQHAEEWIPLQHISPQQGRFSIYDSVLSEEAVLAFEYGYATAKPDTLVIWEAQFGDFANNAQVVIDQFISSGEQKWNRLCGLVMLLPHGYEGQGPEHSSARPERYLQMCAQQNMQVCIPTTPAQMFHLLRRQLLRYYRKPLIIFSPKSLLRHKLAVNTLEALSQGQFEVILDDVDEIDKQRTQALILCSGKVYYDLLETRRAQTDKTDFPALIRLEQLYPFPAQEIRALLTQYPALKEIRWTQEEPRNQGAWESVKHRLRGLDPKCAIHCFSRPAAAAPAVGLLRIHRAQQRTLIHQALGISS